MDTSWVPGFTNFIEKELLPGADDLERLETRNRKHVQKLVYTNVVDRFDYLIDKLLLDNCREELLISKAFAGNDQPIRESDLIKLLLETADLRTAVDLRLQEKLRFSALRLRHSRKLSLLLSLCDDVGDFKNKPRVNPSTGDIKSSFKIQIRTTPHSICGYADYLYSRRNAIVHGAGSTKFLERDREQIKKSYNVDLTKGFRISISSIRNAARYYKAVCLLIERP